MVSTLVLASVGIASAKSYDVVLTAPAMVGNTQLKPGQYKLKVEGSQAVLTDVQNSKSVSVPVKIESSDKKFEYTTVESGKRDGMDSIQAIDLGGSNTRLTLGQ
jgi:hypothetical protein